MPRNLIAAAVVMAAFAVPTVAHGATLHQDGHTHRLRATAVRATTTASAAMSSRCSARSSTTS